VTQDRVRAGERVVGGRYAVLSELGRGGMGIVWLAEDRTIGRRVAIKELHLPDGGAPAEREVFEERVLREARAAGRLNDPGVVTVYDVVRESGTTYIVMELIQATTLSDLVSDRGPLPGRTVARIAEQLLGALEAAHAAGVVHRDVKPSNIMVLPNGRVKLTDFGIAQSTDEPRLTTSGILVGSPVYMAPERLRGADADAGSDLWALGAVLFFAVEGHAAFERASTAATMHAILTEVPYLTRCQGPLASVITGLLNTHPEARPSAAQVRELLGQATATPPDGFAARTAPVTPFAPGTTRYAAPAAPAARRGPRWGAVLAVGAVVAAAVFAAGFATGTATGPDPQGDRPAGMDATLTYGAGGVIPEVTWSSYPTGACLNGGLERGRRLTASAQVECDEPHDLQFFLAREVFPIPAEYDTFTDVGYPGQADLVVFAERLCTMAFGSARVSGDAEDKAGLRYRALVPAEDAWEELRDVLCVLYQPGSDQLTESMMPLE
jgi:hypothetical protein